MKTRHFAVLIFVALVIIDSLKSETTEGKCDFIFFIF